jgi:hypothetical protein
VDTPQQLMEALRRGEISVGVVVPPDFERRRLDGREAVQVLVDGSDSVGAERGGPARADAAGWQPRARRRHRRAR